jgi:hypothetical protein
MRYFSPRQNGSLGTAGQCNDAALFLQTNSLSLGNLFQIPVGGQRLQTRIIHGPTDSKVIQALPGMVTDTKYLMHCIIEKATDTRGSNTDCFGFEV